MCGRQIKRDKYIPVQIGLRYLDKALKHDGTNSCEGSPVNRAFWLAFEPPVGRVITEEENRRRARVALVGLR